MDGIVDLAGRARLAVVGADAVVERAVRRRMEPYQLVRVAPDAVPRLHPDVVLELDDDAPTPGLERLGDTGDGHVTAWDGRRLWVRAADAWCALPVAGGRPARFSYRPGFPVWSILGPLVTPALQLAALDHGAVAVHASAVEVDGDAILIAGWSESGKTETALAFAVSGDRLISDKWTLVGPDGRVAAFPAPLTIRRWVLRYLPELRDALPSGSRAQLALAGGGAALLRPLRRRAGAGPVSALAFRTLDRTFALAERAPLSARRARGIGRADGATPARGAGGDGWAPDEGPGPRLRAAVMLVTTDAPDEPISILPTEPCRVAQRLAISAAAERRAWIEMLRREAYASLPRAEPAGWVPPEERIANVRAREETTLARALASTPVFEVRAPFPSDPRLIAEAVRGALRVAERQAVSA